MARTWRTPGGALGGPEHERRGVSAGAKLAHESGAPAPGGLGWRPQFGGPRAGGGD